VPLSAWRYDKKWEKVNRSLDLIRFGQQLQLDDAKRGNPLLFGLTMDEQDNKPNGPIVAAEGVSPF
jgi:hypothetical protein